MAMNSTEKKGCRGLLQRLTALELKSLFETVTKNLLFSSDRTEMVEAILAYSESALELLKRQRVKRDIIFKYLADEGIVVSIHADKHQLIDALLAAWNSENPTKEHENRKQITKHKALEVAHASPCQNLTASSVTTYHTTTSTSVEQCSQLQTNEHGNTVQVTKHNVATASVSVHSTDSSVEQCNNLPANVMTNGSTLQQNLAQEVHSWRIGESFAQWFYKLINSQNPTTPEHPEDFGPHHFWNDANLHMICITPEPSNDHFSGAEATAERLLSLTKHEQLLFNPNVTQEGTLVKTSPHGMLQIVVCGTVHRGNDCLGTFDQMFGLIRDPRMDNNWKIKVTKLMIRSAQVTAMPKLTDRPSSEIQDLVAV